MNARRLLLLKTAGMLVMTALVVMVLASVAMAAPPNKATKPVRVKVTTTSTTVAVTQPEVILPTRDSSTTTLPTQATVTTDGVTDSPSAIQLSSAGGNYVIITDQSLLTQAQRLAGYRVRVGGYYTTVITVQEIYDNFSDGRVDPLAIRDFIRYALSNWAPAPEFVVLFGEGSTDYDNLQGYGDSLVPPLMITTPNGQFASDVALADVIGADGVPEVKIGRLPVDASDADAVLDKLQLYDAAVAHSSSVLMAADNADTTADFPASSDALSTLIPSAVPVTKAYVGQQDVKSAIKGSTGDGSFLVNWVGHGAPGILANEAVFTTFDVPGLNLATRPPLFTIFACGVGNYGVAGYDCLAERLVTERERGAIAVLAATAPQYNSTSMRLASNFMKALWANSGRALGDVVRAAQSASAGGVPAWVLYSYNLLGDPGLLMQP